MNNGVPSLALHIDTACTTGLSTTTRLSLEATWGEAAAALAPTPDEKTCAGGLSQSRDPERRRP